MLDVFISGVAVAFAHPNHEFNRLYIGENELQIAVEVGPKYGRVHVHMIQHLAHRSSVNIDPRDVKEKVEEKIRNRTGLEMGLYVSKVSHESENKLLAYIDKDHTAWGQVGKLPNGIWTYSWNNDGMSRDWTCSHTVTQVFGGAQDIGSGFINNDDYEEEEPPPPSSPAPAPAPVPAPAPPNRRTRQPEYVQLIPAQNLTPANRVRTANTPIAPPPPTPQVLRGRARELNELLNTTSNFLAGNRRGRGR